MDATGSSERLGANALSVVVIDATSGYAAEGVLCAVERCVSGNWEPMGRGASDASGVMLLDTPFLPGMYRVSLDADPYFTASGVVALLSKVTTTFRIPEASGHRELRAYITANSNFSITVPVVRSPAF